MRSETFINREIPMRVRPFLFAVGHLVCPESVQHVGLVFAKCAS